MPRNGITFSDELPAFPQPKNPDGTWPHYSTGNVDANFKRVSVWQGTWSAGTYHIYDEVIHAGSNWVATPQTGTETTEEPGTGNDWTVKPAGMKWVGSYDGVKASWKKDDVTISVGILLVANKDTAEPPKVESDDWDYMATTPSVAYLGGAPSNYSPGTSYSAITGWPTELGIGFLDGSANGSTGVITLQTTAEYKVNVQVIFQQGNTNKELAILLWMRSSIGGDFVIASEQVSDDKTNWRSLGASFGYGGQAGETLQVGISRVNGSIGTVSFQPCTFDVDLILPVDLTGIGL